MLKNHDVCLPSELCISWPVFKERDMNIMSPNGAIFVKGRHSSVGTATCYGLDFQGIGSALIQTGSGAHPAFHSMDTTPGRGVDHLLSSSTQVKERVEP
jgi:hypothetical protein